MAFCKYSNKFLISNKTEIDNIFIAEYLPTLPPSALKCYLYGMYQCQNASGDDNTIEAFSKNVNLTVDEVKEAFQILDAERLVQNLNVDEFQVIFISPEDNLKNIKKFSKSKYESFNTQIQNIIEGRMLTPNEFAEYYTVIESFKMDADALLLVAKYCTKIKGSDVGHSYITTVAKNWALSGTKTAIQVNEKLLEQERALGSLKQILETLKISRIASIDERTTYIKWKKEFEMTDETVLFACKFIKNKSFSKLDDNLTKYQAMGIKSIKEIENFETSKQKLFETSKQIAKNLGLYFENFDPVIEQYVSPWLTKGFSEDCILEVSKMCFKQNYRSLESMNTKLEAMFKKGILNLQSLENFNNEVLARDRKVEEVLAAANIVRAVTNFDRSMYNTWTTSWEMPDDVILFVAKKAENTVNAFAYINKILKDFKEQNIKTLESAKLQNLTAVSSKPTKVDQTYMHKNYDSKTLNAMFANLDEVMKND